jgi:predicted O-linked N-acetylglucosamine transferase (SPINDLY family)
MSARTVRQKPRRTVPVGTPGAVAAWRSGNLAFAEAHWRSVLVKNPKDPLALRALSDIAHRSGRHEEAVRLLRSFAAAAPEYSNLGVSLEALGQHDAAGAAYRKAIALDPALASARLNLGNLLNKQQRSLEAEAEFRAALTLRDGYAKAWNGLGHALQRQGRPEEALQAFRSAVQHEPASALAHCNLGTLLFGLDRNAEALTELKAALRLDPNLALAHGNLGALLARSGCPIAAESASRTAIALAPHEHCWLTNLGVALFTQGRHAEAEQIYRKALAMRPDYAEGHGNLVFALNYRADLSAEQVFAEYREWDRRHARHLAAKSGPFDLNRTPGRRLRVGYVSADFRQHAVAMFAAPLLAAHDRSDIELYLYAGVAAEDAVTTRFRSLGDHWRSTIGLSDVQLAEAIRADRIDVLVDLAGHSAGNRLLTFARRPAPVQVAYLLGHGYSTGLSVMDAFLADAALAPEGAQALFSERIVRLPRIPLAYEPPKDMPAVAPLPALSNGFVTFGHFGWTERLNDDVVALWARILHAVPRSRLVLDNRPFQEPSFRDVFLARFARHGINPARLDLVFSAPQVKVWRAYGGIDIALDPFPHNAGTTTIEALWQGVPVVSLAGRPTVGRFGAAILHAVGLDD